MRRLVIAGTASGVGKTSIATGLMSLLSRRMRVQAFKVGPDFIDPMFHTLATGRPSRNLDSFLMTSRTIRNAFGWACRDADLAIVEGVRGLYEGLEATGDTGSTADVAKKLGAPVILVVNARSLTRSAAAQVMGFRDFDPDVRIAGVILNQVRGERHRQKAITAVEESTGIPVIGAIERGEGMPERHLGLVTVPDCTDPYHTLSRLEKMVSGVDTDALLEISEQGEEIYFPENCPFPESDCCGVRVGVPVDRSFCFYYPENLEAMKAAGCKLVYFKPTEGDSFPDADAYYLGGGYPEIHARELSENTDFLEGIRNASDEGKPVYGECGGLLVLTRAIRFGGREYPMAGVFSCTSEIGDKREGLSYVEAEATASNFMFYGMVRGHEFHYSRLVSPPSGPYGYRLFRGRGIDGAHDGLIMNRTMGAFLHRHALSDMSWGMAWVKACTGLP